jgi:hypothetical protein
LLDALLALGSTPTRTEVEIAALAHVLWEKRGRPEGLSEEDWFQAEQALRAQGESNAVCFLN